MNLVGHLATCLTFFVLFFSTVVPTYAAVYVQITEYPTEIKILSEFKLVASVSGLPAGKSFNYKVGVATTSTYYGYGEVKKGDTWIGYNDADSCNLAPTATADDTGYSRIEVTARVRESAKTGEGKLRFKICDPDKTSISYTIKLLEADKPPDSLPEEEQDNGVKDISEPPPAAPSEPANSAIKTNGNEPDPAPASGVLLPKPTPNLSSSPASKPERRLPATLTAIPAILSQSTTTAEASAASPLNANDASPSSPLTKPIIIISGVLLFTAITAGGVVGYRYFRWQQHPRPERL